MKYIERGKKNTIALIPGWATDYRIFNSLDIGFNYLVPVNFSPYTFTEDLLTTLKDCKISKVSLFGWSLGGFCASRFASKYPHLTDEMILVGIRARYHPEDLEKIKLQIKTNKSAYLYKFYAKCFYRKDVFRRAWKDLLKNYCEEFSLEYLVTGLDYLKESAIDAGALKKIRKVSVIHGEFDEIAPIEEAQGLKKNLGHTDFICVNNAGHAPFLEEDFNNYI